MPFYTIHHTFEIYNNLRETERNKGTKLVIKIFQNIINNPSQTQKYGNLHAEKIHQRLKTCEPAYALLFIAGFKYSANKSRLIWSNNNNNVKAMSKAYDALQSMINLIEATTKHKQLQSYTELIQSGFTIDEALAAIAISKDQSKAIKLLSPATIQHKVCFFV